MSIHKVVLLLGSNLNDRKKNLEIAKSAIGSEIGMIVNESKIIETEPEGFVSANHFLNQTVVLETIKSPICTLKKCKEIEHKMGRVYLPTNQKHQDRIIDIDILTFDRIIFCSNSLTIPHPQIISRKFVKKIV